MTDSRNVQPPDNLSGLIERVTFFNEETGFAVLKVKTKGQRDLITVVGALPAANPGEWLTAEGRWVQDREFGQQFRAELLRSVPPTTREGVEKYLGSGMVKGIGPVYAKKLVEHFGERIFDVIEQESARLETVEGIGPKRRQRIKDAWAEQKIVREIMVFLHSHGVSTSRAVRIYKTYGPAAIEKVQANPYALALDIHGIGFRTADAIAQKIGVPRDSVLRACAGLRHVLLEATGSGHCALPANVLYEEAAKLLETGEAVIHSAIEKNLDEGLMTAEEIAGQRMVFLPELARAEKGVAARILRLRQSSPAFPPIDIDKALIWCREKTGTALSESQEAALRLALKQRVAIITGGPGVGKTTLLNAILRILGAKKVRCELCAPTGRAAKRLSEATGLEARTIHRLLEVRGGGPGGFGRNESNPLQCDLLVVDECSMVDIVLMHHLLRALPLSASLLLVGDADQLPSVGPGMVLRDLISSGALPVATLREVFRQAGGSQIVANAHLINQGMMPNTGASNSHSDFYFIERDEPDAIAATLVSVIRDRIARRFSLDPVRDVQVLCPMNRGSLGIRELNFRLQEELNPAKTGAPVLEKFGWRFREGDKVIQTENDYDKEVFNGDIGCIESIDGNERELKVAFDTRKVTYDFGELDELMLAYAITIHKSQGSEFPAVVIPIATQQYVLLQRNLIYTGITRGKKLVVLIGQRRALAMAVKNDRTDQRYGGLLERITKSA